MTDEIEAVQRLAVAFPPPAVVTKSEAARLLDVTVYEAGRLLWQLTERGAMQQFVRVVQGEVFQFRG